jgi:hypothetical protein
MRHRATAFNVTQPAGTDEMRARLRLVALTYRRAMPEALKLTVKS